MKLLSSVLLFIAPITLALPTSLIGETSTEEAIEARQCFVTCGSTCYTSAQVSAARTAGYNHYTRGTTVGSNSYPHTYRNLEGFDFLVGGPYQEFPLRTSGVYTGGKISCQFLRLESICL